MCTGVAGDEGLSTGVVGDEGAPRQEHAVTESPHPLPMPAYGGYYAPLGNLLSESVLPTPLYQRLVTSFMIERCKLCTLCCVIANNRKH